MNPNAQQTLTQTEVNSQLQEMILQRYYLFSFYYFSPLGGNVELNILLHHLQCLFFLSSCDWVREQVVTKDR
jgi:hypothetical protein